MKILRYTSFGLMAVLVGLLLAASVVELLTDAATARALFYTAPYTIALWAVMAASALWLLAKRLYCRRQRATLLLHVAFALILCGALLTHLTGEKGRLELVVGEKATDGFVLDNGRVAHFPFAIRLLECHTDYYPGTQFAMDYVSCVELTGQNEPPLMATISMNNILRHRHYRFYQTSIGPNRTLLTVAHDPWGIGVTYAGYALLLVSMSGFLFRRDGLLRTLFARKRLPRAALPLLLLLFVPAGTRSADTAPRTLQRGLAAKFSRLAVCYNDRVCPMQTLARDFCLKLYGRSDYRGLTAEQVLTGWIFYYDDWKNEPMIRIKDEEVRRRLGIEGKYARLTDFYGAGGYRLNGAAVAGTSRRALQEADEKAALAGMVCTGNMLKIYPCRSGAGGDSTVWLSWTDDLPAGLVAEDWRFVRGSMEHVARCIAHGRNVEAAEVLDSIARFQRQRAGTAGLPSPVRFEAEILYNRLSHTRPLALTCLTVGLLAYAVGCLCRRRRPALCRRQTALLRIAAAAVLLFLTVVIVLRGYVAGHLPLTNGFETMLFMALCAAAVGLALARRSVFALPFGLLVCGLSLLVATMGAANPSVTPLMPVLASPLLSLHVVVIMAAYTLLAVMTLNSLTALLPVSTDLASDFRRLNRRLLRPALLMLSAGIFVGAVWANHSWGAYWSWDPKETWALITLLVYAFPLHDASLPAFGRDKFFHIYILLAFATVLMTYFGVNFLLGGMHSYA